MENRSVSLSRKKIVIVTHKSRLPVIPGNDLKKFALSHKCSRLLYITHPLLYLKDSVQLRSEYELYEKEILSKKHQAFHFVLPEPLLMIKDFIYSIFWVFKTNQTYDIYFGLNNLNALGGLVLKKLGRVKKVVYYTIDLFPERFENKFINWIYHKIDQLCVKLCDETWNVSPFIVDYRKEKGMTGKAFSRQFIVPIGIWFDGLGKIDWEKVKRTKMVYVGHVKDFFGVDLAVRALPLIRKKIPDITLAIIGDGEQLEELKDLSKKLKVSKNIIFHGWQEKKDAEHIMSDSAIGLAPFNTTIIDEKIKNADPAKIKDYLKLGLPVILTDATINAQALKKAQCGIIIDFTPESLASAVTTLIANQTLHQKYRKNSLRYVKQFDWNILFAKNISRLLNK